MLFLVCAILSSSAVALILKYAESRALRRLPVVAANYLAASVLSVLLAGGALFPGGVPDDMAGAFLAEAGGVFSGDGRFSAVGSTGWAVLWGVPAGLLYFLGLVSIQRSIRESGVGLTGAFSKSAILIPILVSVLLWQERPTAAQWVGIALTFCAIALSQSGKKIDGSARVGTGLILMFLAVGSAELSNKVFQQYALPLYKELFLFTVFFTAFLIAAAALLKSRQDPTEDRPSQPHPAPLRCGEGEFGSFSVPEKARMRLPEWKKQPILGEFLIGLLVGIPNLFSSYFLLQAFATLNASVVFPLYSAGSIVLITIGGVALFGERPARRELAAIAIVLTAIVLMGGD